MVALGDMERQDLSIRLSSRQAIRFLCALLNRGWQASGTVNDDKKIGTWFHRHRLFGRMLPQEPRRFLVYPNLGADDLAWRRLEYWRQQLQLAWTQESPVQRRVSLTQLVAIYGAMMFSSQAKGFGEALRRMTERASLQTGLKPDAFLQVLHRGREIAHRMRKCANPGCRHPFFIARRVTGKFCSKMCAAPAKQESKNRWWAKHGAAWQRERRAKRRASKSQRKRRGGK
jgi:hypothetical protein